MAAHPTALAVFQLVASLRADVPGGFPRAGGLGEAGVGRHRAAVPVASGHGPGGRHANTHGMRRLRHGWKVGKPWGRR